MRTSPPPDRLALTVQEACRALGISRSVLYLLLAGGELPSIKVRKRRLISVAALEAMIIRLENTEVAR